MSAKAAKATAEAAKMEAEAAKTENIVKLALASSASLTKLYCIALGAQRSADDARAAAEQARQQYVLRLEAITEALGIEWSDDIRFDLDKGELVLPSR